jgi:hypothetical protein
MLIAQRECRPVETFLIEECAGKRGIKGIPLPWWTKKVQTQENLDEKNLHAIAATMGVLAKSADLKSLGFELVSRLFKGNNTLPAASNDARPDHASVIDRRTSLGDQREPRTGAG